MSKIHLVHGIHTGFASPEVAGLVPYLEKTGMQVVHPDYGYILAAETRRINPIVVGLLTPYVETGDVLIGHSNGCAIIYDMLYALSEKQIIPSGFIFINGALEQRITVPAGIGWGVALYNEDDTMTRIAEIAAFFGTAPRTWGEMGHGGYIGSDARIENVDQKNSAGMPAVSGHSSFFTAANLPAWGDWVQQYIVRKLSPAG